MLIAALVLGAARPGAATTGNVLVLTGGNDAIFAAIGKELRTLGLAAVTLETPPRPLEEAAARARVQAALRVSVPDKQVAVWVRSPTTGRAVRRDVRVQPADDLLEPLLVLTAVELLRAALIEAYTAPAPQPAAPPSSPAPPQRARTAPKAKAALIAGVGPGLSFAGTRGALPDLGVNLGALFARRVVLEAQALLPLRRQRLDTAAGRIDLLAFVAAVHAAVRLFPANARMRLQVGAGGGLLWLAVRAHPDAGFAGHDARPAVPVVQGTGGGVLRLSSRVALRLEAAVVWATAPVRIRSNGATVATVGRPWISGRAAVEVALW